MTLWEIWTCSQPYFWITDINEVFQTILSGKILPLIANEGNLSENFPAPLAQILLQCWNLNPEVRTDIVQVSKMLKNLQ